MTSENSLRLNKIDIAILAVVLALGIFLRLPPHLFSAGRPLHAIAALHPQSAFTQVGFDEGLYRQYVNVLIQNGLISYPDMVESYIATQTRLSNAILPPVRFTYIFAAYTWHLLFGSEAVEALRDVAALFSASTLLLTTVFVWRLRGLTWAIAICGLMAFAPTQIHMSQHALIDGFFAFWALLCIWLLWENLHAPRDWRWLVVYGLALAALVITKENSFFVCFAIVVLLIANHWLRFGTFTRELLLVTIAGPLLGIVILTCLAGGLGNLITTYQLLVSKASQTQYALLTGDGPWYRYLVDLLLVSPIILILAFGTLFRLDRNMKPELFMVLFIAGSYIVMCNVKYGMNLRYANMWDMPLRFLAFSQIVALTSFTQRWRGPIVATAVVLLAAVEFRQYLILAVQFPLYELITHDLLRAVHILKP